MSDESNKPCPWWVVVVAIACVPLFPVLLVAAMCVGLVWALASVMTMGICLVLGYEYPKWAVPELKERLCPVDTPAPPGPPPISQTKPGYGWKNRPAPVNEQPPATPAPPRARCCCVKCGGVP